MPPAPPGAASRAERLAGLPPAAAPDPALRAALLAADPHTVVVLDDDPTGTQTVHGVPVVTRWGVDDLRWGLSRGAPALHVLTNSRALPPAAAAGLNREILRALRDAARAEGVRTSIVSRGDSTLRGHFDAETTALREQAADLGEPFDGVVFCPAYPEAGRITAGDEHWIADGDRLLPVSASHYARDATFGFTTSRLPDHLAEVTGGKVAAAGVRSIGLDDIRRGGPGAVAAKLRALRGGVAVVNAVERADLDTIALALLTVRAEGLRLLHRTGPSLVPALAGIAPRGPLEAAAIHPAGPPGRPGLVVVGSHVELTGRQVAALEAGARPARIELDVRALLGAADPARVAASTAAAVAAALDGDRDVLLITSRDLVTGGDGDESLAISRRVSATLVDVVRRALDRARPAFVLAKGGITSSEVFTTGLGAARATVAGSLLPGMVSLWRAEDGTAPGLPYVVFAGNVGGDGDLLAAVRRLGGLAAS